jgi:RNA recognition motif-containing protein
MFVGNLHFSVDNSDLIQIFHGIGIFPSKTEVKIDWETGRSRGFGFVNIISEDEANRAIETLSGKKNIGGRTIHVSIARPREPHPRGLRIIRSRFGGF